MAIEPDPNKARNKAAGEKAVRDLAESRAVNIDRALDDDEARRVIADFDPAAQVAYYVTRPGVEAVDLVTGEATPLLMLAVAPKRKPNG